MADQPQIGSRGFWALWTAVAVCWGVVAVLTSAFHGPGSERRVARIEIVKLAGALEEVLNRASAVHVDPIVVCQRALNATSARTNSLGEFLDPWGVGYEIIVQNRTNLFIRSAGPNGKFGDKDDIAYDSASKVFLEQ